MLAPPTPPALPRSPCRLGAALLGVVGCLEGCPLFADDLPLVLPGLRTERPSGGENLAHLTFLCRERQLQQNEHYHDTMDRQREDTEQWLGWWRVTEPSCQSTTASELRPLRGRCRALT